MITVAYVRTMARYNAWQNHNLYGAAETLPDEERRRDRGAFFGSIHKTLNHLLWADRMWMSRFASHAPGRGSIPESIAQFDDWPLLSRERVLTDAAIETWATNLKPAWLDGELTYRSRSADSDLSGPRWLFLTHMFNHQTHHRGQVHAMLTAAGASPAGTDLPFMPPKMA